MTTSAMKYLRLDDEGHILVVCYMQRCVQRLNCMQLVPVMLLDSWLCIVPVLVVRTELYCLFTFSSKGFSIWVDVTAVQLA